MTPCVQRPLCQLSTVARWGQPGAREQPFAAAVRGCGRACGRAAAGGVARWGDGLTRVPGGGRHRAAAQRATSRAGSSLCPKRGRRTSLASSWLIGRPRCLAAPRRSNCRCTPLRPNLTDLTLAVTLACGAPAARTAQQRNAVGRWKRSECA